MEVNETNSPLAEVPAEERTPVPSVPTVEEAESVIPPVKTPEEVIARLKEIDQDACNADKQEIDQLKQSFYKSYKADQEAARKAFVEGGGKPEEFVSPSAAPSAKPRS